MRKTLAVVAVGAVLGFGGEAVAVTPPGGGAQVDPAIVDGSARADFRKARAKWRASGIRNYRITVARSCFCIGPGVARITVRRGKVAGISIRGWYGPRTVPGMFRFVHAAIRDRVPQLDVTYSHRLGVVRNAWIDRIAMAVDDEIGYRILRFRQL